MDSPIKRSHILINGNDKYEYCFDLPTSDL